MKTAMQELREDILSSVLLSSQTKTIVCAFIDNHLEKERQQIIDAVNDGSKITNYDTGMTHEFKYINGEAYYNETYLKIKSNEQ